jgi:formylglycine-generating enzyme required for sulfatase activity
LTRNTSQKLHFAPHFSDITVASKGKYLGTDPLFEHIKSVPVKRRLLSTAVITVFALQILCAIAHAGSPQIEMVYVKGGCFQMGDLFEDGDNDEKPVHKVCVNDFSIGKYEVTQEQWVAVMGSNPSKFTGARLPVEQVSWNDVQLFIEKLNAVTGKHYRLPTEAEWEYAARSRGKKEDWAGTSDVNAIGDYVWYDKNSNDRTHEVGMKKPNGLGIYDMSGNVWEWVSDYYDPVYYEQRQQDNPQGPSVGSLRVSRGGSLDFLARNERASFRGRGAPESKSNDLGFRLAMTPDRTSAPNIEMISVKGGCYQMGDTFGDGVPMWEQPVHEVCIDDFSIGKYEVTQGQWKAVMGNNPSFFRACGDNCPVERVSWNDAQEFIRKMNEMTGKRYRLPTEAEWEFAARSRGKHEKYAGTSDTRKLKDYAWFEDNSGNKTHPVGRKKPNGLGIYDMNGNVWEWVKDSGDDYKVPYYKESPRMNPQGPENASHRIVRGGSWYNFSRGIRAAVRRDGLPDRRSGGIGFRLAGTP